MEDQKPRENIDIRTGETAADEAEVLRAEVGIDLAGSRLDQALAVLFSDYSRSRLQTWIKQGRVTLDERVVRPREPVRAGQRIVLHPVLETCTDLQAQDIDLAIVHEDDDVLVVNKPAGMVVHPAAGNPDGTLLNALLHHFPGAAVLPRAGIVHRLDKDTTGVMVVAKTLTAHKVLVDALQARDVKREYAAVVNGVPVAGGQVDQPIGRHPTQRTRMAVVHAGKPAVTHYRVSEKFRTHSLLQVNLETGRTHQIRVHMAHIRHSIIGDPVYGGRPKLPPSPTPELVTAIQNMKRQALHARKLVFKHPADGREVVSEAPLPADMVALLDALREDGRESAARR